MQLCVEFEELQTKNERLESSQASLREELMSARRELGRTEAAAKASAAEEKELKRSISNVIRAVVFYCSVCASSSAIKATKMGALSPQIT